jgi:DNA-binding MarR family transcriptional regulator
VTATATPREIAELGAELRNAIGRTYRRFRAERGPGELADGALAVLTYISKRGPQTLTALSENAGVRPSSMSQVVNRLSSGGFVVREDDPADRRRVLFRLTDEGERIAGETIAIREEWFAGELARLDDDERAALRQAARILARIAGS